MWRLRRAIICESGSVREASLYSDHRNEEHLIPGLLSEISLLNAAEEQLRDSGTLWEELYEHTAPLVEEERRKRIQSKKDNTAWAEIVDRELFLNCIASRKQMLELLYDGTLRISQRRWEARIDTTPFHRKRTRIDSSATRSECIGNLTGHCRDCWRVRPDEIVGNMSSAPPSAPQHHRLILQNKANKCAVFSACLARFPFCARFGPHASR